MKRMSNKLFLCSLTSLAVLASSSAFAEEMATAPSLEGGLSGMLGGFLFVPSTNDQAYNVTRSFDFDNNVLNSNTANIDSDYDTGWQAAIGYVFDGTANGIELSYRNFDGSNDAGPSGGFFIDEIDIDDDFLDVYIQDIGSDGVSANQDNTFENWDLMISQFLDVGTHMQVRFLGGISYLSDLQQTTKLSNNFGFGLFDIDSDVIEELDIHIEDAAADGYDKITSQYDGLGPRVGMDARYDFGERLAGFGIVGGASAAYFLGELETKNSLNIGLSADEVCVGEDCTGGSITIGAHAKDENDNHAVTNLRANLGIDYVYFFDNDSLSTLGLELGYEVDTYFNGVGTIGVLGGEMDITDVTFSGPYLNIKGVF